MHGGVHRIQILAKSSEGGENNGASEIARHFYKIGEHCVFIMLS